MNPCRDMAVPNFGMDFREIVNLCLVLKDFREYESTKDVHVLLTLTLVPTLHSQISHSFSSTVFTILTFI